MTVELSYSYRVFQYSTIGRDSGITQIETDQTLFQSYT
ncbi:hypothetical protein SAMN04488156_106150 [Bacillus sp. 166amftsu]|nr:hypothetical protein SAMN04488156_106150 [Bacillus sp. 166amftsu]